MRHKYEMAGYTAKPEYRQALQELIKFEIQALIERLADTGEEAVILTASLVDNVSTQFGSSKGEGFLGKQSNLSSKFLAFCCDEATQSSADEMSYEESVVSKSTAPDSEKHRTLCNSPLDVPDRTMELSLKVESPQEDAEFIDEYRIKKPNAGDSNGKDEKELENSVLKSSDTKECMEPKRPTSASSADSVDTQSDLPFDNDLQCKICNRFFRSIHTLAQHVRFHAVKSYKCSACNKVFSIKASFKQHICSRGHLKPFKCEICDASFMDQGSWKRHKEHHFGIRNHSCDVCGMAFYEKYSLRVHQTSHFYTSNKSYKDVNSGFTCHICQKYFKTKKDMKNHLVAHSTKKYSCEFCNNRFSLKYNYLRHRRIHTGDRPYKCGLCENAFSDSNAWAKHVKMHSVIKGYSCSKCGKAYYDKFTCNQHQKSCKRGKHRLKNGEHLKEFDDMDLQQPNKPKTNKAQDTVKSEYEVSDSESQVGPEKVSFINEDEHYTHSEMGDTGFDKGYLHDREQVCVRKKSPSNDPLVTAVVENVKHDIKFQKDFVERHMPDKPFDSENEFITSNFPEGAEMLDNDTLAFTENEVDGNETEDQSDSNDVFLESKKHRKNIKSHSTPYKRYRRGRRHKYWRSIPESPAKCQRCSKSFKNDNTLKKHQMVHCMLKKLYKCRYCDRQLSSNSALVRHERLHRGERPYECHLCQKCFADKSGCIRHIRVRHHLDNTTKLSIFKPVSDAEVKQINDTDVVKPTCKADLGNKFNILQSVSEMQAERKFINVKSVNELKGGKTQNCEIFPENVKDLDLAGYNHDKIQNPVADDNGKKFSLNNEDELPYFDESLRGSKAFEVDCDVDNTNTNNNTDEFNLSQHSDIDYMAENSCLSESVGFETNLPTFEDTSENLRNIKIESHAEIEKSHIDSEIDLSETERTLLNSGANLYKCAFCGLLFDSEANCSFHISEECSNYRISVSDTAVNTSISDTKTSVSHVSLTASPPLAVTVNPQVTMTTIQQVAMAASPQVTIATKSLLSQTKDLKTSTLGNTRSASQNLVTTGSVTKFNISSLLSQTAVLKTSADDKKHTTGVCVGAKISATNSQVGGSSLLTAGLYTTTQDTKCIPPVSVATERTPTQYISLLNNIAGLKNTSCDTVCTSQVSVTTTAPQFVSLLSKTAVSSSLGLEQKTKKADFVNLQQMPVNKVTTTCQLTAHPQQISTGKPQFVCAGIPPESLKEGSKLRLLLTSETQKALLASVRLQPSLSTQTNIGHGNKLPQTTQGNLGLNTNQAQNTFSTQQNLLSVTSNLERQHEISLLDDTLLPLLPNPGQTISGTNVTKSTNSVERIALPIRAFSGGKPCSFSGKPKSFGGKPKSASNLQNKCLVCSKTFKNKHTLKQHTAIHQDRKFSCHYCVKKFHNKYGLERHVRTHTKEKPYTCVVCSRGFAEKTHLVKHSKQHEPNHN